MLFGPDERSRVLAGEVTRALKNLGLTFSLEVGYRLAPRGDTYLRWLS